MKVSIKWFIKQGRLIACSKKPSSPSAGIMPACHVTGLPHLFPLILQPLVMLLTHTSHHTCYEWALNKGCCDIIMMKSPPRFQRLHLLQHSNIRYFEWFVIIWYKSCVEAIIGEVWCINTVHNVTSFLTAHQWFAASHLANMLIAAQCQVIAD